MPFALHELGASSEEIRQVALSCIYHLNLQLKLIADTFGLAESGLCQYSIGGGNLAALDTDSSPPIGANAEGTTAPVSASTEDESDDDVDYNYDVSDFSADDALLNQFT